MIDYNGKNYVCRLDFAMDFIRGKWKAVILCHLYKQPKRFLELQRITNGISQKVLNEKLKELEIKYERVKLSEALLGEGENAHEAKREITELVREIDKCIALLNK